MKTIINTCLGFKLSVSVPSDTEEFDKLAGKPGAALDEANNNVLYRGWNAEFRQTFLEKMETETKVPWPVDKKKTEAGKARADGTKSEVLVSHGDYFDLLVAKGFTVEQMTPIAVEVAKEIAFDPAASPRSGGKIGKEFLTAADQMLLPEFRDKLAGRIAKLESLNPGLKIALDDKGDEAKGVAPDATLPSRDTLAKAIKVNADRKYRIAQLAAAAELDEA